MLLHAGLQDSRMWAQQVPVLARRHHVICLDLPGHGQSTGYDTTQAMQQVLLRVLDELQVKQVALVGISLGGACALDFALAHPERVSKLALVSTSVSGLEDRLDAQTKQVWPRITTQLVRADTAAAAEEFTRAWFDGPARRPNQVNARARRLLYQTTLTTMRAHRLSGWPRLSSQPAAPQVAKLTVPVLVMVGQQDLPFILACGQYLQQTVADQTGLVIANAGHMVNLEAPALFNRSLLAFLRP
ncbi:alpha/beta fold hydrolase [Hymenobacter volaticus]|uniref:Alpha/beta hydrolase n=1 Tax=Hymenobacter volaticus TaxID=2932254 RepID=A0ABY4GEP7_9BACT|nr:alpha/beta hydrolase [Hymenobacter volaticus]UOQ69217.1 alpha/beta hydrolase [Hymenobacter volaticus]